MQQDEGVGVGAVDRGLGEEVGGVDDGEVADGGNVGRWIDVVDEHVPDEEAAPGALGDDADADAIVRVGPGEDLLDEKLLPGEVGGDFGEQRVELRLADVLVHRTPGDVLLAARFADGELVVGGAAGVLAGVGEQRAAGGDFGFAAPDGLFVQNC